VTPEDALAMTPKTIYSYMKLDMKPLRAAKADARAAAGPIRLTEWRTFKRALSLGYIDPDATLAGLSDVEKRALMVMGYYAALRLEVTT
jgi:hypothetical protein